MGKTLGKHLHLWTIKRMQDLGNISFKATISYILENMVTHTAYETKVFQGLFIVQRSVHNTKYEDSQQTGHKWI
jgi:hypothetical protein